MLDTVRCTIRCTTCTVQNIVQCTKLYCMYYTEYCTMCHFKLYCMYCTVYHAYHVVQYVGHVRTVQNSLRYLVLHIQYVCNIPQGRAPWYVARTHLVGTPLRRYSLLSMTQMQIIQRRCLDSSFCNFKSS